MTIFIFGGGILKLSDLDSVTIFICKNVSTISLDLPFELFIFAYMSTFVIDFPFETTRRYLFESCETEYLNGEKIKTFLWHC